MKRSELETLIRNIVKEEITSLLSAYTGANTPQNESKKTHKPNKIQEILLQTQRDTMGVKKTKQTVTTKPTVPNIKKSPILSILEETAHEVAQAGSFGIDEEDFDEEDYNDDDEL